MRWKEEEENGQRKREKGEITVFPPFSSPPGWSEYTKGRFFAKHGFDCLAVGFASHSIRGERIIVESLTVA